MKKVKYSLLVIVILLLSACGGGSVGILGETDAVQNESPNEAVAPEDSKGGPPSNSDEVILPSSPSAPVPSYDEPAPLPEDPAPSADPVAAFSLTIDAEKKFDTRFGLVKLTTAATGKIEELYVWSDGFNRETSDKGKDDPCGPIMNSQANVTRHLLVNSIEGANLGYDLNDPSPALDALLPYLDSAQLCDESICEGYAAATDAPPSCRMDLDPAVKSGSFYTRTLTRDAVYHLCAKTPEGTTCVASDPVTVPEVSFEGSTGATSTEGKIRFTLDYLNALRAVRPPSGCVTLDGGSHYDDRDRGRGTLVADCPVDGSKTFLSRTVNRKLGIQSIPAEDGQTASMSLKKIAEHRLAPDADLAFTAYGIGSGNADARYFNIERTLPVVTLKAGGAVKCDDSSLTDDHCPGRLDLIAEAYRDFDLLEVKAGLDPEVILHGRTSADLPIGLASNEGPASPSSVQPESPTEMRFKGVPRNHFQYKWRASVELDGQTYKSPWFKGPRFPAEFKLLSAAQTLHPSNWDTCEYEDTDDGESECGVCVETSGFYQASVAWEARHLKQIGVYCTSANEGVVAVTNPVTIPDSYEKQGSLLGGPALAFQVPVNRSNWSDELVCVLTGEAYDGAKILEMQAWRPSCAYTHGTPGDPHDPDLEGAFIENGAGWANEADLWTLVSSQWDGE